MLEGIRNERIEPQQVRAKQSSQADDKGTLAARVSRSPQVVRDSAGSVRDSGRTDRVDAPDERLFLGDAQQDETTPAVDELIELTPPMNDFFWGTLNKMKPRQQWNFLTAGATPEERTEILYTDDRSLIGVVGMIVSTIQGQLRT